MVTRVISTDVIGTMPDMQREFVFHPPMAVGQESLQVSGQSYATETVVSEIGSIRLGEQKKVSSVVFSTSPYHQNQSYELSCDPKILEIQYHDNEIIVKASDVGRTHISILIEGLAPIRREITVLSPPLQGVPEYWDASSEHVDLPEDITPAPHVQANFESVRYNGQSLNRCTLIEHTPVVQLNKNGIHVSTLQVRYDTRELFEESLEISCFLGEPSINLPAPTVFEQNLCWFDSSGNPETQHAPDNCGVEIYNLKGKSNNGIWSDIVNHSGDLIRCMISTLEWDFNRRLQVEGATIQVTRNGSVAMQVIIPKPVGYPKHFLEDLEHSLSPWDGFHVEKSNDGLSYYVSMTERGRYSTTLTLFSAPYGMSAEVNVVFEEALDFSERSVSQIQIHALVAQGRLRAVEYTTQMPELQNLKGFQIHLTLNDDVLMNLHLNRSEVLFPIHSYPELGRFSLRVPWHPFFSPLEIAPQVEIIELDYLPDEFTLRRSDLVEWEPMLHRRLKQRETNFRRPVGDTIRTKITRAGKETRLDDIGLEHLYPVIIAFPHNDPPQVYAMFDVEGHEFNDVNPGTLALFNDPDNPLILIRGEWKDGRAVFLENGNAVFNVPGIYILGLCLPFIRDGWKTISGETWCGADSEYWGFRYTRFIEIEVI